MLLGSGHVGGTLNALSKAMQSRLQTDNLLCKGAFSPFELHCIQNPESGRTNFLDYDR